MLCRIRNAPACSVSFMPVSRGALRDSELDRGAPHAAGSALDKQGASLEGTEHLEPGQSGHGGQTCTGGLLVVPCGGRGGPGRKDGQLGCRAGDAAQSEDAVPDAHPTHVVTDLVDHADGIASGDRGQFHGKHLTRRAAAYLPIDGIDAGRGDADADLAGPGTRVRRFLDHEGPHTAVLVIPSCAHDVLPYLDRWARRARRQLG
ncbi:hypothetical protein DSC45_29510 [Streptomyces sp. YIM 130001]|nr:hypothetical protein DSC45_29510 [Streptomyces sp. YIM 130001]